MSKVNTMLWVAALASLLWAVLYAGGLGRTRMEERMERRLQVMSRELALTDAQKHVIAAIMKKHDGKMPPGVQMASAGLNAEIEKTDTHIKAVLSADQQEKYDLLKAKSGDKNEQDLESWSEIWGWS